MAISSTAHRSYQYGRGCQSGFLGHRQRYEPALSRYTSSRDSREVSVHVQDSRSILTYSSHRLQRVSRDRLLALVLGTCSPENVKKIASAFPSIELLDGLIQYFLSSPSLDAQAWFHLSTFSPSKLGPELLACIVSAGAASIPDVSLRKLGYALHEASRMGQSKIFEEDNTAIRDLQQVRTFLLQLKIGIWSGIRASIHYAYY
jgi:hypothetical protein